MKTMLSSSGYAVRFKDDGSFYNGVEALCRREHGRIMRMSYRERVRRSSDTLHIFKTYQGACNRFAELIYNGFDCKIVPVSTTIAVE